MSGIPKPAIGILSLFFVGFFTFTHDAIAAAGATCVERPDTCDEMITTLPKTISVANRTYCLASSVSGTGAITVQADNVKVVGQGKLAPAIVAGSSLTNRTCVTLKNLHFSSSISISGGSNNRILNCAAEGGFDFGGATSRNTVQGNDFRPTMCSQSGTGFGDGTHHNLFINNTVIKDESALFQCSCRKPDLSYITVDYKCGGNRYFNLHHASDNEIIGNTISLTNPRNNGGTVVGGGNDAEIAVASYGSVRTIWRNNNFYFKLHSYSPGYGFYIRDGTTHNLIEANTLLQDSNYGPAVTTASGAITSSVTQNMFRGNRIQSYDNGGHGSVYLQNLGSVNYFIGNTIINTSGNAIQQVGWEMSKALHFIHNSAYSNGNFINDDSNASSTRSMTMRYNIGYTLAANSIASNATGQWSINDNLFYRLGSSSPSTGLSTTLLGNFIWADPMFTNAAILDLSLMAGSPARADTSTTDSVNVDLGATPSSTDLVAPSAPSTFSASAQNTGTQALLTWNAGSDNRRVVSYQVFRDVANSGNWEFLVETTLQNYTDSGLAGTTAYSYRVRSVDLAGNVSGFSTPSAINGGTVDALAPAAPAGLAVN